jgi:hypothetical protein
MNWKERERKRLWPELRYYLGIFLQGPRNAVKTPQSIRSIVQDLNLWTPEYKAALIPC